MKLLILVSIIACLFTVVCQEKKDTDPKLHLLVTGDPYPASVAALSIERGVRYPSVIHLKGDVEIKWRGMRLFADEADYHEDTGEVEARGNVRVKPYPQHSAKKEWDPLGISLVEIIFVANDRSHRAAKERRAMSPADFRRIALSLKGAEEGSHMGAADFRVGGRIFATLASQDQGYGNLMLTPKQQREFVEESPELFVPAPGGWGRMGITHIRLAEANEDVLAGALRAAWKLRIEKNARTRRRRRA